MNAEHSPKGPAAKNKPTAAPLSSGRAHHHRQSRDRTSASAAVGLRSSVAGNLKPLKPRFALAPTGIASSFASSSSVAVRSSATDRVGQVRASRAKGKHGKDAGRVNGSAIGSTEDAGRRRLAAARGGRGALDRERASAKKGTQVNHTGAGRRPHRANHHADGPGHTSRIGVLGHANGAAIHAPCVLAPLGPALAIAAPVSAGSPSTAVTATATAKTA